MNDQNMNFKQIDGGVCASIGFSASGEHLGIRKNKSKRDVALIYSSVRCATACVYTTNLVKGAPIYVTQSHLCDGFAQAAICNSGNANTCNANGIEIANGICDLVATELGISANDVVVASTGVIGQPLKLEPFSDGMKKLVTGLASDCTASNNAAEAIMTTDLAKKEIAYEFQLGGKTCHIGGIGKGSGMIAPNMATMLVFITTDVNITPKMLQKTLSTDIQDTFNMLYVDGDTSTNDQVTLMASGLAGNQLIDSESEDFRIFAGAVRMITMAICRMMASDGEGATKSIEVEVSGARTLIDARLMARSVVGSNLVKCAIFGSDANWGRILCAIGYSDAYVDIMGVHVSIGSSKGKIAVCEDGSGVVFDEAVALEILKEKEIRIEVVLTDSKSGLPQGDGTATAYGCDLTYEYVKINGDYRT